jgi:geranylgeranyl diphosphate synthase type I
VRDEVEPAMRAAVHRLGDELQRPIAYHLGWCDEFGVPTSGGGKGVRPALALLSAEAVGADAAVAVPGAAAIELVHNFSLLHDDVMDGDRERRHRPTVWALSGVPTAIIAGDALMVLALQLLLEVPGATGAAAARRLASATAAMIQGQVDDMTFESRVDVGLNDCITMEARKTGAILACAASIGAELAGAPARAVDGLDRYGLHLGLAFQAVDDLLGIWGDPTVTGKPANSDLTTAKKSLPVVAALDARHPASFELRSLLATPGLDDEQRHRAAELIETCGGRERTAEFARRELALACDALEAADLQPAAVRELLSVAHFVVERDF